MADDRVEERIANLTTAQNVTHDRLDQIDETLDALDRTIRGDYEKDTDGLIARFKGLELSITKLNAVVFQDSTGKKGLVGTVDALVSRRMDAVDRRKNTVSIIVAIITSTALVLTNIDRLGDFWIKIFGKEKPDKLQVMLERAKRPPRTTRVRVHRVIDYSQPPAEPSLSD